MQPHSSKHQWTLSQKSQSEMTAFSKIKPPQKSLNCRDTRLNCLRTAERGQLRNHTALAKSDEGTRVGRLIVLSGHRKAGSQLSLLSLVCGWGVGCTLTNMSLITRNREEGIFSPKIFSCSLAGSEGFHSLTKNLSMLGHNSENLA